MNSNLIRLTLVTAAFASLFTACKNSGSLETDKETGVQYQFFKHDENGKKPAIGDYAHVKMIYRATTPTNADSEIYNTGKNRRPGDTTGTITIPLQKTFSGCVEQGITLMSVGDSAMFKINADSLFLKTFHQQQMPKFVKSGTMLTFYIKLASFETKDQMQQKQQAEMAKRQAEMEQRKGMEPGMIAKYIADNHYEKIKPTADSLFVLDRKPGKGKAVKEGDSITVTYKGTLLDGTVFDASEKHEGPLKMVYSANMRLIKGWIEMLGTMHEGEKAKILVPSSLAYGPQQMGQMILPYTPLVFELEVIGVKSGK